MTFPYELVEPPNPARRAPWSEEKEESASHHWLIIICFAQLRAEKHRERPPEPSGDDRKPWKCNFSGHLKIQHFPLRSPTFRQELQQLTLVLKITFDNLKCEIVPLKLHSWHLNLNWWKHDFPPQTRRTSGSSPKGALIIRKGGECFAPLIYNHLLCAAARRKHRKRPPEASGDDQKPWKCHFLGHLEF